jgi:uncharacterized Zn-finger protein
MNLEMNEKEIVKNIDSATSKPFVCTECSQSFSRPHLLKSHLYIHQGLKPFPCPRCNKSFARQHDLKRHEKLHEGLKPFSCIHCGRYFSRNDALVRHLRTTGSNGACCSKKKLESLSKSVSLHSKTKEKRDIEKPFSIKHIITLQEENEMLKSRIKQLENIPIEYQIIMKEFEIKKALFGFDRK